MSLRGRLGSWKDKQLQDLADGKAKSGSRTMFYSALAFIDKGDEDRAKVLLQKLVDSGDPHWAPLAAGHLGVILESWGDLNGAATAFRLGTTCHDPEGRAFSGIRLGAIERKRGDLQQAAASLRLAADSGDPKWSGRATGLLGLVLEELGDAAGAKAMMKRAVASDDPVVSARALIWLGQEATDRDPSAAEPLFRQVAATDLPAESAEGALLLGELLVRRGDSDEAEQCFRTAIETGSDVVVSVAEECLRILAS